MDNKNKLFPSQSCQDPKLTEKFRAFHQKLVEQVIAFCVENNLSIDEFYLEADCLSESIPQGKWTSATDSRFIFKKFTDEYKEVSECKLVVDEKEYNRILSEQEPLLFSW